MPRPTVVARFDGEALTYDVIGQVAQPLRFQPRAGDYQPEQVPEFATVTMGPESWNVPISEHYRDLQMAAIRWDREQFDAEHPGAGLAAVKTHPENTSNA